jgi:hypothetical protein
MNNPLLKHFRQPKLFIRLPSNGDFYPKGSIEITENNEYPVLAMTAKDELMIKTPDALLNGQSTVSVIQSCIPNIKNAWNVPSIDIDAILIAIRIATYGEHMDISINVPGLQEEKTYSLDLRTLLDRLSNAVYDNLIVLDDFKFEVAPISYKKFTEVALKSFEEQRLFKIVNDDSMSELDKLQKFNEAFSRLTDLNIKQVINSVKAIQFQDDDVVDNAKHIEEFLSNVDKNVYAGIISHIDKQREKFSIKPMTVAFDEEEQSRGAPPTLDIPITFDQSNFFA